MVSAGTLEGMRRQVLPAGIGSRKRVGGRITGTASVNLQRPLNGGRYRGRCGQMIAASSKPILVRNVVNSVSNPIGGGVRISALHHISLLISSCILQLSGFLLTDAIFGFVSKDDARIITNIFQRFCWGDFTRALAVINCTFDDQEQTQLF